jgi:hypothetical protein
VKAVLREEGWWDSGELQVGLSVEKTFDDARDQGQRGQESERGLQCHMDIFRELRRVQISMEVGQMGGNRRDVCDGWVDDV